MGHYSVVVADDEEAVWEEDESGKVTHIILVHFICYLFKILVKFVFRKTTVKILLHL